ncbi:MAG: family 10 glycosylhydrolase [Clostridia bacterium]|nr:family 10 glycosylhydrolase [Clostridia bacterium]
MKLKLKGMDKKTLILITSVAAVFVVASIVMVLVLSLGKKPENSPPAEEQTKTFTAIESINGVWIATVSNTNFPSAPDLSEIQLKSELDSIVENAADIGLNAIFFQVRPASDSLYNSEIFPVSEYLSTNGELTLDCLDYLVKKAKDRGIGVHAWINPLRVATGGTVDALADGNPAKADASLAVKYADGKIYYDCGNPKVRQLICNGIREVVENYDVAGIVFDDYFYPYPVYETHSDGTKSIADFDDAATYAKYGQNFDDIGDWRRNNVNTLIEECYKTVKEIDQSCLFGVSPFGIWKNGYGDESGSRTSGAQSYYDIYCDTLEWAKVGYIDYVAPQLYWTNNTQAAPYGELIEWWGRMLAEAKVPLLVSHAAYRYSEWESPSGIITSQVVAAGKQETYCGSIFYGYGEIYYNKEGIINELMELYGTEKQEKADD